MTKYQDIIYISGFETTDNITTVIAYCYDNYDFYENRMTIHEYNLYLKLEKLYRQGKLKLNDIIEISKIIHNIGLDSFELGKFIK